jgi:hypothetical protein
MGMTVIAECDCGFETETKAGGSRSGYRERAYFPFFCKQCGLVTVNVARSPTCPSCQSTDIKQYGKAPMTLEPEIDAYIQYSGYFADSRYNYCPACQRYSMNFVIASLWH